MPSWTRGSLWSIVLVVLLSGCIGDDDLGEDDEDGQEPEAPTEEPFDPGWPALADAAVRPGVRVASDLGGCTSNFVFNSPDNKTLYLGLAAHCVPGEEENETVEIAGGAANGTVVYNAWMVMDSMEDPGVSTGENDFVLIKIPEEHRDKVHPSIVHFGGPTGLAEQGVPGDKILTYGTSSYRQGIEPLNPREGYVWQSSRTYTSMHIVTPGVWGDSGSAVVNSKGEALGVLVHLGPAPATNGATNLHAALEFAKEHAGIDVELATWEILDPGLLPPSSPGSAVGLVDRT